ncbi:nuclear transport factor 2 family protein [Streptomyces sp900105245]|uniref:Nuclear transport factor 2 family protein n=1 Tax=Streptomyces sp. 900105245 TaxID=3154379 RepID=A0ABV1UKG8_9ACTN
MRHNMDAFAAGDIDGVVDDYAIDAVIVNDRYGAVCGHKAIKALFHKLLTEVFPPENIVVHTCEIIIGPLAFYTWRSDNASFGTDTFVVEDGKITLQTFAAKFNGDGVHFATAGKQHEPQILAKGSV